MGVTWDDSYSVGIEAIDRQHRTLLEAVGRVAAEAETGAAAPLSPFLRAVQGHFRGEEQLFARHGYPEGALHKQHHDVFIGNVIDLEEKLRGGLVTGGAVVQYLGDWLVNHITHLDTRYTGFLLDAGAFGRRNPGNSPRR